MSWDSVGALAELFGAVAVVVSVVYLALQIKNQTVESKLSATRDLAEKRAEILKLIATDADSGERWLRAIRDYESLKGVDRMQASMLFHMVMRNAEQEFIHAGTGHADDPYLESVDRVLARTVAFPGLRQWWRTTGEGFNQSFQDHINSIIASQGEAELRAEFVESNKGDAAG